MEEEKKPKAEKELKVEKKPKKEAISIELHQEFAKHYFRKQRIRPGKSYKFEESYKALESQVKALDGLKAKNDKTIAIRGGKVFKLTEKYPNPPAIKELIEGMHEPKIAKKILNSLFEL